MKKFFLSLFVCSLLLLNMGAVKTLNIEKNAFYHNNKGVNYLNERDYYAAIKEFEMAIQINPKTQATAVYYNNLGRTYIIVGQYKLAQLCFENSMKQNSMNFDNYEKLVFLYKQLGLLDKKIKELNADKDNPLNEIMLGLMYIEKGQTATGMITLDDFCHNEPDLLITGAVENYIKSKQKKVEY